MILYNDATSPFGRKIAVAAVEHRVPLIERFVDLSDAAHLDRYNPLRQIPVLVTDEDRGVYDSDVILLYVDEFLGGGVLFPHDRLVESLTLCALANGLIEATMQRMMELRRPAEQQSPLDVGNRTARIERALAALEAQASLPSEDIFNADHVTIGCALGYVDFRYSPDWRAQAPRLSSWYQRIARRPSFVDTAPTRSQPADLSSLIR